LLLLLVAMFPANVNAALNGCRSAARPPPRSGCGADAALFLAMFGGRRSDPTRGMWNGPQAEEPTADLKRFSP
jgi:hypothetical protein